MYKEAPGVGKILLLRFFLSSASSDFGLGWSVDSESSFLGELEGRLGFSFIEVEHSGNFPF